MMMWSNHAYVIGYWEVENDFGGGWLTRIGRYVVENWARWRE